MLIFTPIFCVLTLLLGKHVTAVQDSHMSTTNGTQLTTVQKPIIEGGTVALETPQLLSDNKTFPLNITTNTTNAKPQPSSNNVTKPTTLESNPKVTEESIEETPKASHPHSVPRKGVEPNVNVKKPTVLEVPENEEQEVLSNSEIKKNLLTNDLNFEKQDSKTANYVIPIVAVILSVPLVAFILSVSYKRCTDWWQRRHYRRMDFLIEGMYNN